MVTNRNSNLSVLQIHVVVKVDYIRNIHVSTFSVGHLSIQNGSRFVPEKGWCGKKISNDELKWERV